MKLRRPQLSPEHGRGPALRPEHSVLDSLYEWRAAIVTGVLVAVFIFVAFIGIPLWRTRDMAGAPELAGKASVLEKHANSGKYSTRYFISFRIGERIITTQVNNLEKWALTNKDDVVRVEYRVGKSGTLYIDDWEVTRQGQTHAEQ